MENVSPGAVLTTAFLVLQRRHSASVRSHGSLPGLRFPPLHKGNTYTCLGDDHTAHRVDKDCLQPVRHSVSGIRQPLDEVCGPGKTCDAIRKLPRSGTVQHHLRTALWQPLAD